MNDTMPVEMFKTLTRLSRNGRDLSFGHEVGGDDVCERASLHVLHHDPQIVLVKERVDVVDDVGVARRAHDEDFIDDEVLLWLLVEIHLLDRDGEVGADLVSRVDTS